MSWLRDRFDLVHDMAGIVARVKKRVSFREGALRRKWTLFTGCMAW